jgi:hypothetical protein
MPEASRDTSPRMVANKNTMRYLITLALTLISSIALRAGDVPGLTEFAEEYWAAVRSQDPEKIYALYEPKIFSDLSPAEAEFIKQYWFEGYADTANQQGDSYELRSKTLDTDAAPFPNWRWAAKPEYQIEIQTFRNVPNGKEGLTMLLDMVTRRDGRFFIIRAVPPEAVLQKQIQKKNG